MDEESRQKRILILLASVVCAVMIGYNAFYVPDAAIAWAQNVSSSGSSRSAAVEGNRAASVSASSGLLQSKSPSEKVASGLPSSASQIRGKININTASAEELSNGLDGIGDVLSGRIVEYREKNGPFYSIEEIKNVSGIGDKIFEQIRGSITVS
ncbi:helix-hairpin-helix domain-containing protein [Caproiciproducens sp. NJN-50]|uniref:ComEA family DNA-binding protein n=1 Tax=Acutalibacteraceae TaxID=3082771 RepID=UPI000FFE07F9|nr:helix-hairpin-helix domain-containing protein [Caproiciproducens sp. NJN-50]